MDNYLNLDGRKYCPYCGKEINGECNCENAVSALNTNTIIKMKRNQITQLQNEIRVLEETLPKPLYEIGLTIIPIQSAPEQPAEDDGGENTDTEGGEE